MLSISGETPVHVIDFEAMTNLAEREFLIDGCDFATFPVRRKPGIEKFYERFEEELRRQTVFRISEYRMVKEGFAKLSRPARLRVDREILFRERPHLRMLDLEITKWRVEFAVLGAESFVRRAIADAVKDPRLTRSCFEVFDFLLRNREEIRGLLPRQIPHANSTKIVGREPLLLRMFSNWRGEPAEWQDFMHFFEILDKPVEFRFFAPFCTCQGHRLANYHGVIAPEWQTHFEFSELRGTLIVENLETFHAEWPKSLNHLIVWGSGWKAALLRRLQVRFPRPILYWGDIDKEGYEIYGHLKSFIPDLRATLMSREILERYAHLAVRKDVFLGPYRSTAELQEEYQSVCQRGLSLEQEKIHERPY